MDDIEKLLKNSFAGAANQITQLYVQSLQQQKHSFSLGYNTAIESIIQFAISNSANSGTASPSIVVDLLLDFLKKERSKYQPSISSSSDQKIEVNDPPTTNNSPLSPPPNPPSDTVSPLSPSTPVSNNDTAADAFTFHEPPVSSLAGVPYRPNSIPTNTDSIFTFVAQQQPQQQKTTTPQFSRPFSFNSTPSSPQQLVSASASPHRTHHRPHNGAHAHLLQQSQTEMASRKRQIDLIFNPSGIVDVLKPMDQLLKKIKIDQ